MEEILSQNERNSLAIDAEFLLEVTQEMAEVNVENLTVFVDLQKSQLKNLCWNWTDYWL